MPAGLLHGGRQRARTRLLALVAAAPLAAAGLVASAPPASAAPLGGASVSPDTVARHGQSTVTLTLDGETRTQSTPTDLVLVLDESGSIDTNEFTNLKAFADDVVEAVDADGLFTNGGRIGLVGFADTAQTVLPLTADALAVRGAISGNPQSRGGTCIACGLDQARVVLGGDDPARNQLVIFITDGDATVRPGDTGSSANLLQAVATVFAVGIGNGVQQPTLNVIASGANADNTFSAADFNSLEALLEQIVEAVNVPGATDPAFTVTLADGWDLVPGSVTASTGAVSGASAAGFTWSRADLGDELVTVTYRVAHEGAPCGGPLAVNDSVAYSDDEGATVSFPAVAVLVTCAPPVADAGADRSVAEGSSVLLDGSATDADGVVTALQWSGADAAIGSFTGSTSGEDVTYAGLDDGTDTVTLTATDDNDLSGSDSTDVTVTNVAPSAAATSCPVDPNAVGTPVSFAGTFTDPGTADTHSVRVDYGDGTTATLPSSGTFGGTHAYTAAGIYDITATVTDDDGGTDTVSCGFVVVYDPNGGFVTGGGTLTSPAGAYPADPAATGKASFGFVAKYKKGASEPTGSTEFQFRAGDLNFHSDAYQWLVVAGQRAQYKGTGTVNGVAGHTFMLTAVDGSPDRLRMKITRTADDTVVYDNQAGATDTADPATAITSGSIVVHRG